MGVVTFLDDFRRGTIPDRRRIEANGAPALDAGTVHDIRGLLATVMIQAEALAAGAGDGADRLLRVCRALERSVDLCDAVLDGQRGTRRERVRLRPLLTGLVGSLTAGLYPADLFQIEVAEDLMVLADAAKLNRAVFNLLRNAATATAASGGTVRVEGSAARATTCLLIHDTGPGLPEAMLGRLFEPSAPSGLGYGLGLATAADLVRAQSGRLTLIRTGPTGTSFRISLPSARPVAPFRSSPAGRRR